MSEKNEVVMSTIDYSDGDILRMLKDLPDACCVFQVVTDPFGTVRDMLFLFANEKYASLVGKPSAELIGATYYSTVSNRDEDWIRLSYQAAIMRQSVINRTYNTQFNKWFEFWAVPVFKKGFCAFIIHDVTAEKRKEDTKEITTKSNNVIIECAKALSAGDFKKGIKAALKVLGTTLKADRAMIIENNKGEIGEIVEWSDRVNGTGLPSRKEFEQYDIFTMWNKQMYGENIIIIEDTLLVNVKNQQAYAGMLSGKVSNYVLAKLTDKNTIIGYLLVDNISRETDVNIKEVVESVAIFISEEVRNYILQSEMLYMSEHDILTDVGNRKAFNSKIGMLEGMDISVGICFVDINGLKSVNDEMGHEAGDNVIKEASEAIASIFKKKYCYRIGGDEFVVVMPQVSEGTFAQHVERLRKKSKKISMAIGSVWSEKCLDVEELVNIADKNMYADKTEFYSKNDRRKE
ncbi:diguanylate cyclase (GGDEF) domain-containing protein [Pseudobutyrivibrio sp. AR14]|uniref:sensor domain-containing diguanylate cyclase n=1 Tax=Pseudobutyrivibrio sp. AR14 TaxID=1520804 RepID=UPI00089250F8|nr:sensor domain-containing diguanylate cyclase [Pseudobutyrivibrio sp. AR14]SCY10368.1 diguanylate cyclase (GGDEF) domain-containing protein [Pseudobutyrivibrio sp. AR14]